MWSKHQTLRHYRAKVSRKGLVFDWTKSPTWLQQAMQNATYLGHGVSSSVWDLKNGYVAKVTNHPAVVQFADGVLLGNVQGVAEVHSVFSDAVRCVGKKQGNGVHLYSKPKAGYYVIIQKKCEPLSQYSRTWKSLRRHMVNAYLEQKRKCPMLTDFGVYTSDGKEHCSLPQDTKALIRIFKRQLRSDPTKQFMHILPALSMLSDYVSLVRNGYEHLYAMDVHHVDNWGIDPDTRLPVIIDPVI